VVGSRRWLIVNAEARPRFGHACPGFKLDIDVRLPSRGVTAIFGPSGSGKTTLLRLISGPEKAAAGHLKMDTTIWQDEIRFLPTHERPLGFVFQDGCRRRETKPGLVRSGRNRHPGADHQ